MRLIEEIKNKYMQLGANMVDEVDSRIGKMQVNKTWKGSEDFTFTRSAFYNTMYNLQKTGRISPKLQDVFVDALNYVCDTSYTLEDLIKEVD